MGWPPACGPMCVHSHTGTHTRKHHSFGALCLLSERMRPRQENSPTVREVVYFLGSGLLKGCVWGGGRSEQEASLFLQKGKGKEPTSPISGAAQLEDGDAGARAPEELQT